LQVNGISLEGGGRWVRQPAHGERLHAEAYALAARDTDPAEGAARLRELAGGDGRSLRRAAGWFGHAEGQPLELDGAEVRVAPEVGRRAAGLLGLAAAGCADRRGSLVARLLGRR
jgi:hypothetical protein